MTLRDTLLEEVAKLPVKEQLGLAEAIIRGVREGKETDMARAADALYEDYKTNEELTAFTALDAGPFYETR